MSIYHISNVPNYNNLNCNTLTVNSASDTSLILNGGCQIDGDVHVGGHLYVPDIVYESEQVVTSTINSTSPDTGALRVAGGAGIVKDAFIGGNLTTVGTITCNQLVGTLYTTTVNSTSTGTGSVIVQGGMGIAKDINCDNLTAVSTVTSATSNITTGNINTLNVTSTANSLNYANGAAIISGGVGIAKDVQCNGDIYCNNIYGVPHVTSSAESTSTSTGAITILGGVGIAKNTYIGGNANIESQMNAFSAYVSSTTNATNASTGSTRLMGGLGIAKDVYVGGFMNVTGDVNAQNVYGSGNLSSTKFKAFDFNTYTDQTIMQTSAKNMGIRTNTLGVIGTGSVQIITGNLDFSGSGTPSTSVSTGALAVDGGMGVFNDVNIGGYVKVNAATDSSSISTGAITTSGGCGIAKNLNIGGIVTILDTTSTTSTNTGSLQLLGGMGIAKSVRIGGSTTLTGSLTVNSGGQVVFNNTTQSSSNTTGALTVGGGMGLSGNLYMKSSKSNGVILSALATTGTGDTADMCIGVTEADYNAGVMRYRYLSDISNTNYLELGVYGPINNSALRLIGTGQCQYTNTAESTSISSGSMIVNGGFGVAKNLFVGNSINAVSTTDSSDTLTGAVIVSGGAGIAKNVNIGGVAKVSITTSASDTLTGALIVAGGAGIAKSCFVGNILANSSTLESSSTSSGSFRSAGGAGIAKNCNIGGNAGAKKLILTNNLYSAYAVGTSTEEKLYFTTTSTSPFTFCTIAGTDATTAYSYYMTFAGVDITGVGMSQWNISGVMINNTVNNSVAQRASTGSQTNLNAAMSFLSYSVTNGTLTVTLTPASSGSMVWSATLLVGKYVN